MLNFFYLLYLYSNKEPFETQYNGGDMYLDSEFKPECCPSDYTTSSGCLCKNNPTRDMLIMRGGNSIIKDDVPVSPYDSCMTQPIASQCI
tara:strand:+ start:243 stop:512 length:270 start_codon:yes stop_codon:yes gene_type:complete